MGYFDLCKRLAAARRVQEWLPSVPADSDSLAMSDFVNALSDEQREDFELLYPCINVHGIVTTELDEHERRFKHERDYYDSY